MSNSKVGEYKKLANQSLEKILSTVDELSETVIRWKPSDKEWSILQILNHVYEATNFWLDELKTVLKKPGSKWGRGLENANRLKAVENPDNLQLNEVIQSLNNLTEILEEELSKVNDSRLQEENPHRNFEKFGNKPVEFLIEHFIVEHIEGHFNQIQRNLSKYKITEGR